ncbi:MAG: glycosyltransferase [Chthoniobacterales bacterium]|nr:glycosyltransferase [Chthoniobacterales bacterium]
MRYKFKYSVAIPTYNRKKELHQTLTILNEQLDKNISIWIFDNGSNDGTCELVKSLITTFDNNVILKRSLHNIGMPANIARSLLNTDAEWIWLLGDDDIPLENSIQNFIKLTEKYKNGIIEFNSSGGAIETDIIIQNYDDFYKYHDLVKTVFISSHIFHKPSIEKFLGILYFASFTFAPHSVLVLRLLEHGYGNLYLDTCSLLKSFYHAKRWSTLEAGFGISLLPEFISNKKFKKLFSQRLLLDLCWQLSFGLTEIYDQKTAERWKDTVKHVFANLKNYGAKIFPIGDKYRKPKKVEIKDFFIIAIALVLPKKILLNIAQKFRAKHKREIVLSEK